MKSLCAMPAIIYVFKGGMPQPLQLWYSSVVDLDGEQSGQDTSDTNCIAKQRHQQRNVVEHFARSVETTEGGVDGGGGR